MNSSQCMYYEEINKISLEKYQFTRLLQRKLVEHTRVVYLCMYMGIHVYKYVCTYMIYCYTCLFARLCNGGC